MTDPSSLEARAAFVRAHTSVVTPPLVPEIRLHLAELVTPLWEAMEAQEGRHIPPPFWAACWPGGQVLSRLVLDRPELVRGRSVLDFATGCGVSAIAACLAGASHVLATEIAGIGGVTLPIEVSAIDSFPSVTDAPERSLSIVAKISLELSDVYMNNDTAVTQTLERCKAVSLYLLDRADRWLAET